jgi:2-polyprenyl-3-methyl-5-hydroxy-6-metoxy-1,4-benzoquinol methylase
MQYLASYTKNLVEREALFFSKNQTNVSYPNDGNAICFQIEDTSFWFKHRNNCIIEAVKNFIPNGYFFDIGGGNGFVAKGLQNAGIPCVLVEPGISGAVNAKGRGIENVFCSTLEDVGFEENSLPAVGLFDVVEHIEDDNAFLAMIFNYIKPGGYVFITVPTYSWLWSDEDTHAGHFRRYTINSLNYRLRAAGFQIAFQTYFFSLLPLPILLFRSIPSLFGHSKNSENLETHIKDHRPRTGLAQKILDGIWKLELNRIKRKRKIPFGGSVLMVGKKQ